MYQTVTTFTEGTDFYDTPLVYIPGKLLGAAIEVIPGFSNDPYFRFRSILPTGLAYIQWSPEQARAISQSSLILLSNDVPLFCEVTLRIFGNQPRPIQVTFLYEPLG